MEERRKRTSGTTSCNSSSMVGASCCLLHIQHSIRTKYTGRFCETSSELHVIWISLEADLMSAARLIPGVQLMTTERRNEVEPHKKNNTN